MSRNRAPAVALATLGASVLVAAPTAVAAPVATASPPSRGAVAATGDLVVLVDFATLETEDVRGNKCEFTVDATLTFTGTVDGEAVGRTTAVIFAPCDEALAAPPGTYFDLFRFEGDFTGAVLDEPANGPLTYAGVTRVGGEIDALARLDGQEARAVLQVDALVAGTGTYTGIAKAA